MSSSSVKKLEKKLREIQTLKLKKNHSADEVEKISKENHYRKLLHQQIYGGTVLSVLPDDVKIYILEFVDVNTRLNLLRSKYTPDFIQRKLSSLPNDKLLTIKLLYSCIQYVKRILTSYLNKECDLYRKINYYVNDDLQYFTEYFDRCHGCTITIKPLLISMIITGVKHFTKIYKQTSDVGEIHYNEKNMIKFFARVSLL
jgi:hypothetical protein